MRIVHEIDRQGTLFYLINALIGAYNRRTDVLHAQIDPAALEALRLKLKASSENLAAAVQSQTNKPKEK